MILINIPIIPNHLQLHKSSWLIPSYLDNYYFISVLWMKNVLNFTPRIPNVAQPHSDARINLDARCVGTSSTKKREIPAPINLLLASRERSIKTRRRIFRRLFLMKMAHGDIWESRRLRCDSPIDFAPFRQWEEADALAFAYNDAWPRPACVALWCARLFTLVIYYLCVAQTAMRVDGRVAILAPKCITRLHLRAHN